MTTELATTRNEITSLDDLQRIAKLLAASGYFEAKGTTEIAIAQIATKILAGAEMGYGPFASANGIHIIQGKPAVSANLMAAAVKSSARYDYRVRQNDNEAVSIEFFERAGGRLESIGISTFTQADAKAAGTQNMAKFGRNMMFSRAMSNGVKWYCPDVMRSGPVYTPEEMGAEVDGDGEYIDVPAARVTEVTAPPQTPKPAQAKLEPVEVPPEVAMWESPQDAYDWSIGVGASTNEHSARNAFKKAVDANGGKFTTRNAQAVYAAFHAERMARAAEKLAQPLDVSDVTAEDGEALFA